MRQPRRCPTCFVHHPPLRHHGTLQSLMALVLWGGCLQDGKVVDGTGHQPLLPLPLPLHPNKAGKPRSTGLQMAYPSVSARASGGTVSAAYHRCTPALISLHDAVFPRELSSLSGGGVEQRRGQRRSPVRTYGSRDCSTHASPFPAPATTAATIWWRAPAKFHVALSPSLATKGSDKIVKKCSFELPFAWYAK